MYTPFHEVREGLHLIENKKLNDDEDTNEMLDKPVSKKKSRQPKAMEQVDETVLAPLGEEYTYGGKPSGYDLTHVYLRLYNDTNETIKGSDAKVIGINIKKNEDYLNDDGTYNAPVVGVYGLELGDKIEDGRAKVPADALENEIAEDGGAYFTVKKNGMIYIGLAVAGNIDWKGDFRTSTDLLLIFPITENIGVEKSL